MQQRRPIYTWATLGPGDTDIERMALEPWLQLRTHTRPGAGVRAFLEGVVSPAQRFPLGRHQICPSKSLMTFAGPSDQTSPVPLSCFPPALKRGGRGPAPTLVLRWYIPPMMRRTWCRGAQPAPTHVPQHIATEGGVDGRGVWGGAHCLPATKGCSPGAHTRFGKMHPAHDPTSMGPCRRGTEQGVRVFEWCGTDQNGDKDRG